MAQLGTDMIGLAENASALRRKRALLNRAYRAAKRGAQNLYRKRDPDASKAFLQAASMVELGEQYDLKIGTIQRSDQIDARARRELAHEKMAGERITNYFQRKQQPQQAPAVAESFTQAGHTAYPDEFLYNLGLLQRHAPEY